ncbi:MAG: tol-pal system protein YbgF [Alphaproteobacteria bacterium]|nr:tol-pal system protein YbgF [Alphaproteobacteria bacterium]
MKSVRFFLFAFALLLAAQPALAQDDNTAPMVSTQLETRISSLEDQMRDLNGRIEQTQFDVNRLNQALQRFQTDADARLTALETKQAALAQQQAGATGEGTGQAESPEAAHTNLSPTASSAPVNGTLGSLKMQDGKVTSATDNPKAPPLPAVPPGYGLTPKEQYERAFGLLRQANYPAAEKAFKAFIDKNPKDKLIDNAKYWYGETLYVRAKFAEAAVAFADAYQQAPRGNKAPDSLLKLAMSLSALHKKTDACVTLHELKTKYPHAAPTIRARAADELNRLKCPPH